jgi:hypothetical protein
LFLLFIQASNSGDLSGQILIDFISARYWVFKARRWSNVKELLVSGAR